MEAINRWFQEWSKTETGSIVLFVLVFITRVAIDRWQRNQERKRSKHRKGRAVG